MTPRRHRYRPLMPLLLTCLAGPVQAAFTDNGDGTVTDTVTGLMWDQCAWGLTWNAGSGPGNRSCTGTASTQDWTASLTLAKTANAAGHRGHNDWRLPNRTELVSLVNYAAQSPAIDGAAFPNTPSSFFWSSTVYAPSPARAWYVFFNSGNASAHFQSNSFHVRLVRSGQSFGAFDAFPPPCGLGIPLTTGGAGALWQQLALPCVPSASPADVKGVFGSGSLSNLTTADYGIPNPGAGTGWVIDRREVTTTPSSYVRLTTDDALAVGTGYWIKSYQAPSNGMLSVAGTATVTDVNQAAGCASANGCKAVTVTTVSGQNRWNLVGNPFPYAIDWSQVRVRVNGSSTTYTPQQAAGLAGSGNASPPVISNTVNIWNGTTYVAFTDLAPNQGNLQYFKSFWVNVLSGAAGQNVELLIPAEQTNLPLSQAAPAVAQVEATASDWQVRLKLDNHTTGWRDHGNQLGQWRRAKSGADALDVPELAPFAKPYLTLVFPHSNWGAKAGDYTTDFRPFSTRTTDWSFEVRADPAGAVVFLSWDGDPAILARSRLIDRQTGQVIQPAATRWAKKGYPITLKNPVQRYVWRYLGP